MTDYYQILGVSRNATTAQIKKAYKKLALKYHPDRNPSPEASQMFIRISEAYQVLSDPTKKQEYDDIGTYTVQRQEPEVNVQYEFYKEAYRRYQEEQDKNQKENNEYKSKSMLYALGSFLLISGIVFALILLISPSADSYYEDAISYNEDGQVQEALKSIDVALKKSPKNPKFNLFKARLLLDIDYYYKGKILLHIETAEKYAVGENSRFKAECYYLYGVFQYKKENYQEAYDELGKAHALGYQKKELYRQMGNVAYKLYRFEEAEALLKKSETLKSSPQTK